MYWRRTAPVQPVGALIATGAGAPERVAVAVAAKSRLFGACRCASGPNWIVLLAAPAEPGSASGEELLPSIETMVPLYDSGSSIWLPVGIELDVPGHVAGPLMDALRRRHAIESPAVFVPRFEEGWESAMKADLYLLSDLHPVGGHRPEPNVGAAA
ncbi:MAG TPA: hypothetical protein VIT45_06020 [Allosphingosinicella sp.]